MDSIRNLIASIFIFVADPSSGLAAARCDSLWESRNTAELLAWKKRLADEQLAWNARQAVESSAWKTYRKRERTALLYFRAKNLAKYYQWLDATEFVDFQEQLTLVLTVKEAAAYTEERDAAADVRDGAEMAARYAYEQKMSAASTAYEQEKLAAVRRYDQAKLLCTSR